MKSLSLTFAAFILVIIQLVNQFSGYYSNSPNALEFSGILLLLEYGCLLLAARIIFGDFLNFFTLFFLVVGLTNVLSAGIFSFGLFPTLDTTMLLLIQRTPTRFFVDANFMESYSLFMLFIGMRIALGRRKLVAYRGFFTKTVPTRAAGLILLMISLPSFIFTFSFELALFRSGGYAALFTKDPTQLSTWYLQLAELLPSCGYFLMAGSNDKSGRFKALALAIILTSALSNIMLGERTGFIVPIIVYFWMRKKQGNPISERVMFGVALAFIIATPFVVFARTDTPVTNQTSSLFSTILTGINDLGTVYYFVPATIQNYPLRLPYEYFSSLTTALWDCVPNIAGFNANHYGVNADIVYWLGNNYFVDTGKGTVSVETGYSFFAEAYQAFGYWGMVPIMLLIGYVFARMTIITETSRKAYIIAFYGSFLGPLLFYARDSFSHLLRPILWFCVPFLLLALFIDYFKVNKIQAPFYKPVGAE